MYFLKNAISDYGIVIIIIILTVPMCKIICQNVDNNKLFFDSFCPPRRTQTHCVRRENVSGPSSHTHISEWMLDAKSALQFIIQNSVREVQTRKLLELDMVGNQSVRHQFEGRIRLDLSSIQFYSE